MGSAADGVKRIASLVEDARREKRRHPSGWEPGVVFEGDDGLLTVGPLREQPNDWSELLRVWGLDPEVYEVDESTPPEFRAWDSPSKSDGVTRLFYYRARVRVRRSRSVNVDDLVSRVDRWRPLKHRIGTGSGVSLVVPLADWQIGKQGTDATIERCLVALDALECEVRRLGKLLGGFDALYLVGMGDIVEQCTGNYPSQEFTVELNRREQFRVAFRLLVEYVTRLGRLVDRMVVSAVGGNHGENRRGGKKFTGDGDNDDVLLFELVGEALRQSDRWGHVSVVLPDDQLSVVLDVSGVPVGFTHGHLARSGGGLPQAKLMDWWKSQAFSEQAVGDARILVSGHYHHLSVVDFGPKVHIQCPSMDSGSKWWVDRGGGVSAAGTLVFAVSDGFVSGFDFLRVL